MQGTHFVDDAAKGPYIRASVIRLIPPYFWTGIVRRSSLSIGQLLRLYFGDVHVADFIDSTADKYVGGFEIAVENAFWMQ